MGSESFQFIYPLIQALADGEAVALEAGQLDEEEKKTVQREAGIVLGMMDNYNDAVPFMDVPDEQIKRVFKEQKEKYGFIVWSDELAGTDEACADMVKNDPDYFAGMSEDDVRVMSVDANMEDLEVLKDGIDRIWANGLLIVGTIGRWNGHKPVIVVRKTLRELFSVFTGDDCTLYIKDGNLKARNVHHDGTDQFTFYTFKEGFDPDECASIDQMFTGTESLVPMLDKEFGWDITKKKPAGSSAGINIPERERNEGSV